ncbi:hypothetical protein F4604DRAFT_1883986 [Suillus subluteus]|nr:hypothetical protein F4604DRAFT_1883986 [Suillus subluteus]
MSDIRNHRIHITPAIKDRVAGESAGWKVYNTAETDKTYVLPESRNPLDSDTLPLSNVSLCTLTWLASTSRLKDTIAKLKSIQGFTVNIISEPFIENASAIAIDPPSGFDEWTIGDLTKENCVRANKASLVKESAFSMECKHNNTLILTHVKYIHVRKHVLADKGVIDLTKFKPVTRLGVSYARVGNAYRITHEANTTHMSYLCQS